LLDFIDVRSVFCSIFYYCLYWGGVHVGNWIIKSRCNMLKSLYL